jgi:(S)-2-hydroxy-acid oxidase
MVPKSATEQRGEVSEVSSMNVELILSTADLRAAAARNLSNTASGRQATFLHLSASSEWIGKWMQAYSLLEFYNSGSTGQITVHENTTAFDKYRIRPRVLVDVSNADASTTVLARKISFPLAVSPVGLQAMAHQEGELATSRACAKQQIHMGVSSYSNYSVEEITKAGHEIAPMAHIMQLYSMQDKGLQERIIRRAEAAGCVAIFLTADSPVMGVRYNEWRNDFRTPVGLEFPMLERTSEMITAQTHDAGFLGFNSNSHSWASEIPWLRSKTRMEIWIKGILTTEDVLLAREYGCDGVIVSNHGGRQLDGTPATIDALPECVDAANGKIRVHVDGGIRSGTDIFKAIALGAECCWIGRPAIWGLAVSHTLLLFRSNIQFKNPF